jgi:glycosyltransferase involved in cell wall biosynthesis
MNIQFPNPELVSTCIRKVSVNALELKKLVEATQTAQPPINSKVLKQIGAKMDQIVTELAEAEANFASLTSSNMLGDGVSLNRDTSLEKLRHELATVRRVFAKTVEHYATLKQNSKPPVKDLSFRPLADLDTTEALKAELTRSRDREASLASQNDLLALRLRIASDESTALDLASQAYKRDTDAKIAELQHTLQQVEREAQTRTDREAVLRTLEAERTSAVGAARLFARVAQRFEAVASGTSALARSEVTRQIELLSSAPVSTAGPTKSSLLPIQRKLITESGLFDEDYYRSNLAGENLQHQSLLEHYLEIGWREGRDPNPLFSIRYYLSQYKDVATSGFEPFSHYLGWGSAEYRDPHPLFLSQYYAAKAQVQSDSNITLLGQFLKQAQPSASPHPLFDPAEYANRAGLPDSRAAPALTHYLTLGWRSNLDLSPLFRANYYRSQFEADISTFEPYTHFVLFGAPLGLSPHPLFDTAFYRSQRASTSGYDNPLVEYQLVGEAEGLLPNPLFDPAFYQQRNHITNPPHGALWHYVTVGSTRDFDPHPDFNAKRYMRLPEVRREIYKGIGALEHFLVAGSHKLSADAVDRWIAEPSNAPDISVPHTTDSQTSSAIVTAAVTSKQFPLALREYPGKVKYVEGRINVLLVAHFAGEHLFGSERSFLDMLEGLAHIPANIFVALPRNVPDYTNAIRKKAQHVFVFKYDWWRKDQPSSDLVREAFKTLIRDHKINVVHANTIMLRECLEAARECNVPGIVHVRELISHDKALVDLIGQSPEDIVSDTLRRADWVIANSNIVARTFAKPDCTFVVPNTIDVDAMDVPNTLTPGRVRFGLISSNIAKKGVADVVELARLCETVCPSAEFLLIGPDTDATRELKQQQADGSLPKNVLFPGYAKSPKDAIDQVDVVLNFSHFAESFGRTVLEAMAARRPVIAYEWGALTELVSHGETGFLVPYLKPDEAVSYVREFCDHPDRIVEFGERGRAAALEFGLERYREKFKTAYSALVPQAAEAEIQPGVKPARLPNIKQVEESPRVAYFCWHFPVPSETFVLNELEVLVKNGVDVIVFCRQTPHKNFKPGFDIKFERVDSPETLARRLKETDRTIVHAHFTFPTVTNMVWPACEAAEIPFTFIAHAQDIFRHVNDQQNRIAEVCASKWCRKVFTLSRFHYDFLVERGVPRNKIVINPNAVDTTRFSQAALEGREHRASRKIIAVHRYVPKKGLDLLIRAAALIRDLDVQIELYGYGEQEAEYRQLVTDLALTNVTVNGALTQDQVIEKMQTADLFACPSVRTPDGDMDGIPTSIVESMAAGLPVLTTDIAGIPDLVVDGITGIVAKPDPENVAEAIRRFYALPTLKVRAIIDEAKARVAQRHDARRLVRILTRVWENRVVDIVIVSWNNLRELRMVLERILTNTALPYHLIICDNQSRREPVPAFLNELATTEPRVTVIHNESNAMVGPGTNRAMAEGNGDYIIYVCGKEGVSFANGWEMPFVHAFEENPKAGLVGSIGYSPTYLTGSAYPKGIRLFSKFRNQAFAVDNPDRKFGHIQGGLFGIRRKMVDEIGGFSNEVPHDYTDVEYSFYAESSGWELAEAPEVLALFNKSRPTLSQRFHENLLVAHPVMPDEVGTFDTTVRRKTHHCNICNWYGTSFNSASRSCPSCEAIPQDRSVYRWLSDGTLMYRRLPAVGVGLTGQLQRIWTEQFQGPQMSFDELIKKLAQDGRLPNRAAGLQMSFIRAPQVSKEHGQILAKELSRLLVPNGIVLVQLADHTFESWRASSSHVRDALSSHGFQQRSDIRYSSYAVDYDHVPMQLFTFNNTSLLA